MRTKTHGFTLLELLIASSIFAIIAIVSYAAISNIQIQRQHSTARKTQLDDLQRTWQWLATDLMQLTERPVSESLDRSSPALIAPVSEEMPMELTRTGWHLPPIKQLPARSHLQRVRYRLEDGNLRREHDYQLDALGQRKHKTRLLLTNVDQIAIRFLSADNSWHTSWPQNRDDAAQASSIPRAIEVTVTLDQLGDIQRLFTIR